MFIAYMFVHCHVICNSPAMEEIKNTYLHVDEPLYWNIQCVPEVSKVSPSRHLTSVGRQIDVRLRRHNDVGFRLILKVCLTSKTDVILTSKTDVILTSEKQRWFDVSNVTS